MNPWNGLRVQDKNFCKVWINSSDIQKLAKDTGSKTSGLRFMAWEFTKTHIQVNLGLRLVKSARNSKIKNLDSPGTKRNATHKKILVLTNSLCSDSIVTTVNQLLREKFMWGLREPQCRKYFLPRTSFCLKKKKAGVDKAWSQKLSHCKPVHLG